MPSSPSAPLRKPLPHGDGSCAAAACAGCLATPFNVDHRLRSVFGAGSGLVIETAAGAGTRVVVRVPPFHPGVVAS